MTAHETIWKICGSPEYRTIEDGRFVYHITDKMSATARILDLARVSPDELSEERIMAIADVCEAYAAYTLYQLYQHPPAS